MSEITRNEIQDQLARCNRANKRLEERATDAYAKVVSKTPGAPNFVEDLGDINIMARRLALVQSKLLARL